MLTFKQYLKETNSNAYGWLNAKGSFVKNRGGIHGDTYTKYTGVGKRKFMDYDNKLDHAFDRGWQRMDIYSDARNGGVVDGVLQGRKDKWTPRHAKAMERIKKALGVKKGYKNEIAKIDVG